MRTGPSARQRAGLPYLLPPQTAEAIKNKRRTKEILHNQIVPHVSALHSSLASSNAEAYSSFTYISSLSSPFRTTSILWHSALLFLLWAHVRVSRVWAADVRV